MNQVTWPYNTIRVSCNNWGGSVINELVYVACQLSSLGRIFRRISFSPPDCFG